VVVDNDIVLGDEWAMTSSVDISIDDPSTTATDDYTGSATTDGVGWFYINVGADIDVQRGFTVSVTDGVTTKVHVVTDLAVVAIDPISDTVTGTAVPNAPVHSWIHGHEATAKASTVASALGVWVIDYSGVYDLVPGQGMGFKENDADGDGTQIDAFVSTNPDSDGDGIPDAADNCPLDPNVSQYDGDGDGIGAVCDDLDRLWGPNRYGTSAAVAETAFQTTDTVFLALGTNFPDALVAAAAGGHLDAPVLLTRSDSLPAETIAELLRLSPSTVYIVGGTAVISPAVEQAAKHYASTVKRLAGSNRYDTAVAVSSTVFSTADTAFIAFGGNFPDALVGAAAAGHVGAPVLLTPYDRVPAPTVAELDRLNLTTIYLVGGRAVISDAVAKQLAPYGHVVRLAGLDRYATAAAVAETVFATADYAFLAYGGNFPDALVGAAAGGHLGGPVLLVSHDTIPNSTRQQLDRLKPDHVYLIGGTAVIGEAVFAALP
jgi:putative cell wall-binding protein